MDEVNENNENKNKKQCTSTEHLQLGISYICAFGRAKSMKSEKNGVRAHCCTKQASKVNNKRSCIWMAERNRHEIHYAIRKDERVLLLQ